MIKMKKNSPTSKYYSGQYRADAFKPIQTYWPVGVAGSQHWPDRCLLSGPLTYTKILFSVVNSFFDCESN